MTTTGTYAKCSTAGEVFQAFVPAPLPPEPPLTLNDSDQDLMEQANRSDLRVMSRSPALYDV